MPVAAPALATLVLLLLQRPAGVASLNVVVVVPQIVVVPGDRCRYWVYSDWFCVTVQVDGNW